MAKLEGVKVLDMVNGEVTRVEYGGEVYEKVDDKALAGDLAYANRDGLNTTAGSFYEVIYSTNRFLEYLDDKNYNHKWDYDGTFSLFRKVAVQPSLADRVTALEARVDKLEGNTDDGYRLVTDREPRVGDYVKFDEAPHCYLTAGKYYEIVKFDGADPIIIDDDGNEYDTCGDEFEVYEKVGAKVKPKVRPTVGDFVKVIENKPYHYANIGEYVKIVKDDNDNNLFYCEKLDGSCAGWLREDEVKKVTDENVLKFLRIGRKPGEFKVGDIVRTISYDGGHPKGTIGEISELRGDTKYVKAIYKSNGSTDQNASIIDYAHTDVELVAPVEARVDRP